MLVLQEPEHHLRYICENSRCLKQGDTLFSNKTWIFCTRQIQTIGLCGAFLKWSSGQFLFSEGFRLLRQKDLTSLRDEWTKLGRV